MNPIYKTMRLSFWVLMSMVITTACSKAEDDSNTTTPAKTLNKTSIAPKKWYSQGSVFVHELKAGGVYNASGTWKWKNNSDTLEIVTQAGYSETYWKVYWNSDTEMECEKVGTFTKLLYKTTAW